MKNLSFIIVLIFTTNILFAQTKLKPKPKAADNSLLVNKNWVLKTHEQFGIVKNAADGIRKNDKVFFNTDGSFTLVLDSIQRAGTWKKGGPFITLTASDTTKLSYKVILLNKQILKVDWREEASLHTIFEYEVK
jgi:hypothetical protein